MGANFVTHTFRQCTPQVLNEKFRDLTDSDRFEDGNDGYSGTIGTKHRLVMQHTIFEDDQEAADYLIEECDKHDDALAVKVKILTPIATKKIKTRLRWLYDIRLKISRLAADPIGNDNLNREVVKRVREAKSRLRRCQNCQSQIATQFIKSVVCPVCANRDYLLTKADKEKREARIAPLKKLQEKEKAIEAEILEIKRNDQSSDWHWMIGAWCPS